MAATATITLMSVMKSTTVRCRWTGETGGSAEDERQRERDGDEAQTDHEAPRRVLGDREGGQARDSPRPR